MQAATENITAKIQQENEKLTQKLHIEVRKLSSDFCTLRNDNEHKFQAVTRTIGGISDYLNERIDTRAVATRKMTDRISQEMNARSGRLLDEMKEYRIETEYSLEEFRQGYSLFREQMNSKQATWQNKAGGEMDKVNDSVRLVEERVARLVEDRVTEIQAETQNGIQKVNIEITYLRGQLAARQLTEGAIPNQVLPVTEVDIENSSQSISGLVTSAGNYHMGKGGGNNYTTSVCGNAKPQPSVGCNSRPAIVNVTSDVFANSSPINELTLPNFYDSSNQILHFLRDLDEYYRIKNVPESLKLPLAMRAVTDPTAKNLISTGTVNV